MRTPEALVRPLRIGALELPHNLVLAPLHRETHLAMRVLARRSGAALVHTEMAATEELLTSSSGAQVLATSPEDRPRGVQVLPGDAAALEELVRKVAGEGLGELVDLNFACPSPLVLRSRRGGAMLRRPADALRLVEAAVGASSLPVTLKLRSGHTAAEADHDAAFAIARGAAEAGAAAITLHARTVDQGYHGRADWALIGEWAARLPAPVIASGDLRSPEAVFDVLRETGCAGASLARGALGRPWVFRQVRELAATGRYRPVTLQERREACLEHFRLLVEQFGERGAVAIFRRVGRHYARGLPSAAEARSDIQDATTAAALHAVIERHFAGDG